MNRDSQLVHSRFSFIRDHGHVDNPCGTGILPVPSGAAGETPAPHPLPTSRILSIIDEITDAGCLFFLITGGEPLLHPDFHLIYCRARERGMLVSVFTNGTLIDESHVELFRELPPRRIEITLYGATRETYERVTRVPGSYDDCMRGIELIAHDDFPLGLKTVVLTLNRHEFDQMRAIAHKFNARFRMDAHVFPRFDGSAAPLEYRVSPEEAVGFEFSEERWRNSWIDYAGEHGEAVESDRLYRCGTAVTNFHIDAFGRLQPCLMAETPTSDLVQQDFLSAWHEIAAVREIPAPPDLPCRTCRDMPYCGYCPPALALENGLRIERDAFACRLGRCRRSAIETHRTMPDSRTEYEHKEALHEA